MNNRKQAVSKYWSDMAKIISYIKSCETVEQLPVCRRMIAQYRLKHPSEASESVERLITIWEDKEDQLIGKTPVKPLQAFTYGY